MYTIVGGLNEERKPVVVSINSGKAERKDVTAKLWRGFGAWIDSVYLQTPGDIESVLAQMCRELRAATSTGASVGPPHKYLVISANGAAGL